MLQLFVCTGSGVFIRRSYFPQPAMGDPPYPDMGGTKMPGPAPKPEGTRRRRNATIAMTTLPAEGRTGPTPEWPLHADIAMQVMLDTARAKAEAIVSEIDQCEDLRSRRRLEKEYEKATATAEVLSRQIDAAVKLELDLWAELWSLPIATQWEQQAWFREVAQYTRWKVRGELGDMEAAKEARMWSDRLGLNPMSMLRLRMQVAPREQAAPTKTPPKKTTTRAVKDDPRRVLRAVS